MHIDARANGMYVTTDDAGHARSALTALNVAWSLVIVAIVDSLPAKKHDQAICRSIQGFCVGLTMQVTSTWPTAALHQARIYPLLRPRPSLR